MDKNYILLRAALSLVHFSKLAPSLGGVPGSLEGMRGLEAGSKESWKGRDEENVQGKGTCKLKHI